MEWHRHLQAGLIALPFFLLSTACGSDPPTVSVPGASASAESSDEQSPEAFLSRFERTFRSGDGVAVFDDFCPDAQARILSEGTKQDFVDSVYRAKEDARPVAFELLEPLTDEEKSAAGLRLDDQVHHVKATFDQDDVQALVLLKQPEEYCLGLLRQGE